MRDRLTNASGVSRGVLGGKRAAIYVRVSTIEQGEGYSLEGQRQACRDYCDRHGYRVGRIFQETGSAKDDDRPAFQYLMHLASLGQFDVLVVWKRDRYFRNAVEAGFYESRLRRWGIRIEDTQRGPLEDSPSSRFTTLVLDGAAELERAFIAERCAMGRQLAAKAGRWPAKAFLGYRLEDGRLTIDLEKAQTVREAYRACIRGSNRHALAAILGVDPRSACRVLRRTAYKGLATYNGVGVPCPPIVEESTWQAAQDAMDARFRNVDMYGRVIRG